MCIRDREYGNSVSGDLGEGDTELAYSVPHHPCRAREVPNWRTPSRIIPSQGTVFADKRFGLGRLSMKLFDNAAMSSPWAWNLYTYTIASTGGSHTYFPLGGTTPLPSGISLVKCTLFQGEDVSDQASTPVEISDVDLTLRVRDAVSVTCTAGSGRVRFTGSDASRDWKSNQSYRLQFE